MTRYFMRDTPLRQMEQQMMTPPNFKPRGHGLYHPGFRYTSKDVDCRYCMNFDRKHPCSLSECPYLRFSTEKETLSQTTEKLTLHIEDLIKRDFCAVSQD